MMQLAFTGHDIADVGFKYAKTLCSFRSVFSTLQYRDLMPDAGKDLPL